MYTDLLGQHWSFNSAGEYCVEQANQQQPLLGDRLHNSCSQKYISLTFAISFSSVGRFLWLPGCKNFLIVGMLLILVLKAYIEKNQEASLKYKEVPTFWIDVKK